MLASRIQRIRIQNYKSIANAEVALDDLTILVGKNGSGKSNFIDALRLVRDSLLNGLDRKIDDRGGIRAVRRRISDQTHSPVSIGLDLIIDQQSAHYGFVLSSLDENQYLVESEVCRLGDRQCEFQRGNLISTKNTDLTPGPMVHDKALALPLLRTYLASGFEPLFNFLVKIQCYSLFPEMLRTPQRIKDPYPLAENGENLAAALRDLSQKNDKPWLMENLSEALSAIVQGISVNQPISVEQLGDYLAVYIKHENGIKFDLIAESDGTLRVLALLTAIYQDYPLSFFAIEEPELLVHPGATGIICDELLAASLRTQIIFTTHSPDLIARFAADSLRIVELENGVTEIGSLRDDQREVINRQLFSGGDLLRIEGLKRG